MMMLLVQHSPWLVEMVVVCFFVLTTIPCMHRNQSFSVEHTVCLQTQPQCIHFAARTIWSQYKQALDQPGVVENELNHLVTG